MGNASIILGLYRCRFCEMEDPDDVLLVVPPIEEEQEDIVLDEAEPKQKKHKLTRDELVAFFKPHGIDFVGDEIMCLACSKPMLKHTKKMIWQHIWRLQREPTKEELNNADTGHVRRWKKWVKEKEAAANFKNNFQETIVSKQSPEQLQWKFDVAKGLMSAGVPFNVMENEFFRKISDGRYNTGGRKAIAAMVPRVREDMYTRMKDELQGKKVAVAFDGSTINYPMEVTILRYVHDGKIKRAAIGCRRVERSLKGADIASLVNSHLQNVLVPKTAVLFANTDRASVNYTAVEALMPPKDLRTERDRIDLIGCFAHTLNNAGQASRSKLTLLTKFMSNLNKMMRRSQAAKFQFKSKFPGQEVPSFSPTRWWSWAEAIIKLAPLVETGKVFVFLDECKKSKISEKLVHKLSELVVGGSSWNRFALEMEFFAVKFVAKPFIKTNLLLQSDGFIAAFVFEIMDELRDAIKLGKDQSGELENAFVQAKKKYDQTNLQRVKEGKPAPFSWTTNHVLQDELKAHARRVAEEMETYMNQKFFLEGAPLHDALQCFKACKLFNPFELVKLEVVGWNDLTPLLEINGFSKQLLDDMLVEAVEFTVRLKQWCRVNPIAQSSLSSKMEQAWSFWVSLEKNVELKAWRDAAEIVALLVPTSCEPERFFSKAKGLTKKTQMSLTDENQETKHLVAYNN